LLQALAQLVKRADILFRQSALGEEALRLSHDLSVRQLCCAVFLWESCEEGCFVFCGHQQLADGALECRAFLSTSLHFQASLFFIPTQISGPDNMPCQSLQSIAMVSKIIHGIG
jgi:hypothetical protein